jgi:cytochrome c
MDRLLIGRAAALVTLAALSLSLMGGAAQAADPVAGHNVFNAQCSICHSAAPSGITIIGPNLYGVVGRKAGTLKGYAYSAAMKASGITWTDDQLRAYLPSPQKTIPGIKMTYFGLKNPVQLENLLAYLNTLK